MLKLVALSQYFYKFILSIDKCKELVGKAKKGTLVYTDIPLVQKLESAPKVNLPHVTDKSQDIPSFVNINKSALHSDKSDYIFGRLKRDAELGDERAIALIRPVSCVFVGNAD